MLEDLNEKNRILGETDRQVKEYSRLLEKNIEQAKEHQAKLISVKKPYLYNVRFSTAYIPCEKVGGDVINIIVVKDIIFFYIADVVGHGVPAAILSSFIKASLDNWIKEEVSISPSILLKKLYDVLIEEEIFKEKFFTIFIGKIFLSTRELQYISAGHLSPILVNLENDEISEITIKGRPVISMFELQNNKHYSVTLPEKSRLLVYSDGLIEWEVNEGEFFGKSKLLKYFQKEKLSAHNLDLILQRVGNKQIDDISFILIDINDTYERTVHCSVDQIDSIVSEFEDEMRNRYKADSVGLISHCFGELFTNAIVHGNKNNPVKETFIKVLFTKELITLRVRDSGEGFNWQSHNFFQKDPGREEDNHGLAYVSTISETLVFNEEGNEVECTFTI
ncbi:MAG: serine/threonine-protein phosphatase, partial [Spirochaetales bacterium]|nr:serine/threonine-protein phosphatase [Spirochaetales bacterium]